MILFESRTYPAIFTIYASSCLNQTVDHTAVLCIRSAHKRCHTALIHTYDFEEVTIKISSKRSKSSRLDAFPRKSVTGLWYFVAFDNPLTVISKTSWLQGTVWNNMCRTISKLRILICHRRRFDFHELPHPESVTSHEAAATQYSASCLFCLIGYWRQTA